MHVCSYLRRLMAGVFFASYGAAHAGTIRPLICGVDDPHPADIAGVYAQTDEKVGVRLAIRQDGTAALSKDVFPLRATAGGIVRMAGPIYSNDWPKDEFAFEGVSSRSGDPVTRRYKRVHSGESLEILDISDPSNPIKLSPQKPNSPFPWTTTAVVASLIVGGLVGRHYGVRSKNSHTAAQSSQAD